MIEKQLQELYHKGQRMNHNYIMDRLQDNAETIYQRKSEMSIVAASSPETVKLSFSILSVCKAINSIFRSRL